MSHLVILWDSALHWCVDIYVNVPILNNSIMLVQSYVISYFDFYMVNMWSAWYEPRYICKHFFLVAHSQIPVLAFILLPLSGMALALLLSPRKKKSTWMTSRLSQALITFWCDLKSGLVMLHQCIWSLSSFVFGEGARLGVSQLASLGQSCHDSLYSAECLSEIFLFNSLHCLLCLELNLILLDILFLAWKQALCIWFIECNSL